MKSVVIVGAGVVGLFCAVRLAKAGAHVTLLEAEGEHPSVNGPGASAAAAGMLGPFGETQSPHDAIALASLDLWKQQSAGADWADGVRFDGGVVIAADEIDAHGLVQRVAAHGRNAKKMSGAQFKKRTGFDAKPAHAVFVEDEGVADPLRVLSGLAMQARAHGVLTNYNCDVASVSATAVKTHEDAIYEADAVVLATGFWASEKLMAAAPALKRIAPAKGHLVPVKLSQPLSANVRAPGFYLAQRREDVVLGATLETGRYDRRVEDAPVQQLLAAAEAVLPGEVTLAGRAWAGVRPMSLDGWPMIGRSGEVLIAAGHSRNGWLLAPITAEIISAYVFGAEIPPHWAALSPQRFEIL